MLEPFRPGLHTTDPGERDYLRLSLSENSYGMSPRAERALRAEVTRTNRYPDSTAASLAASIAAHYSIDPRNVVVGNGIDELLLFTALGLIGPGGTGIVSAGTYPGHEAAVHAVRAECVRIPLADHRIDVGATCAAMRRAPRSVVYICNPHNPTGSLLTAEEIARLVAAAEDTEAVLVMDEAYMEFARPDCRDSAVPYVAGGAPVIVLRTFSKIYGLAGLRCGYAMAPSGYAEQLRKIKHVTVYNVNRFALAAAEASLADQDFVATVRDRTRAAHEHFLRRIAPLPWVHAVPSVTNFVLCRLPWEPTWVAEQLIRRDVLVRPCSDMGFRNHIRVGLGTETELDSVVDALAAVAAAGRPIETAAARS
ncbi:pyridoxal phosphate-dependent aminotransferase [Nocardia terpenica]|uniref:pyridoxal phosphate-dependent aminotransferase n=1 Tax=Nocardia terpenica TaxID=455432 RepID=UPI00189309CA|nr:histidinol-phosphate transaminase [Nocardia terpenica]MBF6153922.1 histidinol-phosphate aminotransferase family protein [Nocardia terpenica]